MGNNLSVILITKNAERTIETTLKSASWASEIVVLDSGSTDNTLNIAKNYTSKIFISESWPGFGVQRQHAQNYATNDWILMLDADEQISEPLKNSILQAIKGPDCIYEINRISIAFGTVIKHSGWFPDWIMRLYPSKLTKYDDALVHEKLVVPDGIACKKIEGLLIHETYENLSEYYQKMSLYIDSWSSDKKGKKYGGLLIGFGRGIWAFFKMYIVQLGFLDGKTGFVLAYLRMETTIMKYYELGLKNHSNV